MQMEFLFFLIVTAVLAGFIIWQDIKIRVVADLS
jgi:hypothetical protein